MRAERYIFNALGFGMIGWGIGFFQSTITSDIPTSPGYAAGFIIGMAMAILVAETIVSAILKTISEFVVEFGAMIERRGQAQTKGDESS